MTKLTDPIEGGCACSHVRYKITYEPLIVHCCHCRNCQRLTGAAFALNALFEAKHVEPLTGSVNEITVPTPSGKGQTIARCPKCEVALWSNYFMGGIREKIRFIRVGTLDNPDQFPPDVHIFTLTKQPWVNLSESEHVEEIFYDFKTTWTKENQAIRDTLLSSAEKN